MRAPILVVGFIAMLLTLSSVAAQTSDSATIRTKLSVDTLKGRVLGINGKGISRAMVMVTDIATRANTSAKTDSTGSYTAVVRNGQGSYLIFAIVPGLPPARVTATRSKGALINVDDIKLGSASSSILEAVEVTAGRRTKPKPTDPGIDIGSAETLIGGMDPTSAGLVLIPGADGNPDGFSALGLSPDQNSFTLDGSPSVAGAVPTNLLAISKVSTATYDVSQGGFSGAQISTQFMPSSNFIVSSMQVSYDAPSLQWIDDASARSGQRYSNTTVGWTRMSPIVPDKLFINTAAQFGRRSSALFSLKPGNNVALQRAGFSPDSVTRAVDLLQQFGIPFGTRAVPDDHITDNGSLSLRINATPSRTTNAAILVGGYWNTDRGSSLSSSAVPAHGGEIRRRGGNVQLSGSRYVFGSVLGDFRSSFSANTSNSVPYVTLPDGRIMMSSILPDGTGEFGTLQFGGNASFPSQSRSATWETTGNLSWYSLGGTHRYKLSLSLRIDQSSNEQVYNRYGTFSYNSLADFESGTPVSFFRTLGTNDRSLRSTSGFISLGDAWKVADRLRVLYGVRLEANRYGTHPQYNPLVEQIFGVRNDHVPNTLHASPRIGFNWTYGGEPQKLSSGIGVAGRRPKTLSGGIGEFRNSLPSGLITSAMNATGLPSSLQQLYCVGPAVPVPDWDAYLDDPATIPTECASSLGALQFSSTNPNVTLYDPSYNASRSWRANLAWSASPVSSLRMTFEGIVSLNLNQQSSIDLNMIGTPVFTLDNENGRPVFAAASAIVPTTGAISPTASRIDTTFSRVLSNSADLRSISRQFSVSISPTNFSLWGWSWSGRYTFTKVDEQSRGYSGTTSGDPTQVEWGNGAYAVKHQFFGYLGMRLLHGLSINLSGSLRSGMPYTPIVSGDVNGDRLSNDRAFVFDSAGALDKCLARQIGRIAGRGSCYGPWNFTLGMGTALNIKGGHFGLPKRSSLSVNFVNPLTGLDILFHGANNLRGWGQPRPVYPDPVLLNVRGFDPATNRYRYELNPRFGETRVSRSASRAPFQIRLSMNIDIAPSAARQMFTQMLKMTSKMEGSASSAAQLKQMLMASTMNPFAVMAQMGDTLELSKAQKAALDSLGVGYKMEMDSLWNPIAKDLHSAGKSINWDAEYERIQATRLAAAHAQVRWGERIRNILSHEQMQQLPSYLVMTFDKRAPEYMAGD